jgi:hypothetical protein
VSVSAHACTCWDDGEEEIDQALQVQSRVDEAPGQPAGDHQSQMEEIGCEELGGCRTHWWPSTGRQDYEWHGSRSGTAAKLSRSLISTQP